jgi:hypothetical protein
MGFTDLDFELSAPGETTCPDATTRKYIPFLVRLLMNFLNK